MLSQRKDTKLIRRDLHSDPWVMPHGWDFGAPGVPRGSKIFFFKHGHVVYQIDRDGEQNRMQVKIPSKAPTGDLGVRSKVKYHSISVTMSISKIFYTKLCVCSHK